MSVSLSVWVFEAFSFFTGGGGVGGEGMGESMFFCYIKQTDLGVGWGGVFICYAQHSPVTVR